MLRAGLRAAEVDHRTLGPARRGEPLTARHDGPPVASSGPKRWPDLQNRQMRHGVRPSDWCVTVGRSTLMILQHIAIRALERIYRLVD